MASEVDDSAETTADGTRPRRHVWLKRAVAGSWLILLAMLCLRLWWGWYADRRLEACIAKYRDAGQPVYLEDYGFETIKPEDNAVALIIEADKCLVEPNEPEVEYKDWMIAARDLEQYGEFIERLVIDNEQALRLAHECTQRDGVDWGVQIVKPLMQVVVPSLKPVTRSARLSCVAATYHHRQGDDEAAIEALTDARYIAYCGSLSWFGVDEYSCILFAMDEIVDVVEIISASLEVQDDGATEATSSRGVSRDRLEKLILQMREGDLLKKSWERWLHGDRTIFMDAALSGADLDWGIWLIRPAFILDAVYMMEYTSSAAECGLVPAWPTAKAMTPKAKHSVDSGFMAHFVSNYVLSNYRSPIAGHHFVLQKMDLAATALAIRLYELDHGRRPAMLDELRPKYLPETPRDRFAADGRAIRYLPDATPPVLYSVGPNGEDENGLYKYDFELTDVPGDIVYFLDGDRPVLEAGARSEQALDEDLDHPDAKGETD